ncbi:NTP transferase domain-containing protein [Sphingomonas sp. RHCKR47]|uniref:nucleotidyltransferase family protein n=1 Tax=Sphingomonas citricola TaxID=2862498 RepID=UPI001CA53EC4|nr:NTP transferase domain-containing protein [Sphingomonas citricola]MBW6524724.1 NTP transferase domain-containing protein [Sphingomonas citricola]
MIAAEDTVLVLLAAGKSARFGDVGSKLNEPFLSRPLGLHVAVALEAIPFKRRVVVTSPRCAINYAPHGFRVVTNDDAVGDMASSVRLGVACAAAEGAAAVLLALADMPRVTASHVYRLLDAADSADAVVASSDGQSPKPPAVFARPHFDTLQTLSGDQGARDLIRAGRHVVTNAAELIDVDTPQELEQLRELVHAPEALTLPGTRRYDRLS